MKKANKSLLRNVIPLLIVAAFITFHALPAVAAGYDNALKDVKGVKALFNVSLGSPEFSNIVFWAVKNVYEDKTVKSLPEKPQVAVVFHGPAVKLLSSDRKGFKPEENAEIDKFQATLKQMKKDGVKLEVCLYAVKVMGVDPATIMPEVDQVGNGFISVVGYQAQGYSVVTVP